MDKTSLPEKRHRNVARTFIFVSITLVTLLYFPSPVFAAKAKKSKSSSATESKTAEINVAPPAPLALAKKELKLVPGQSYWLDASTTGANWSSNKKNIASVTPETKPGANTYGIITVPKEAKPGQNATITVKAGGETQTCTVTIVEDLGRFTKDKFKELCPDYKTVKTFTVPDGYTSIGERIFETEEERTDIDEHSWRTRMCNKSLTELNLPDSLIFIEDYVLQQLDEIEKLEIPCGVTTIGRGQIYQCKKLTSITIPPSVSNSETKEWFENCPALKEAIVHNVWLGTYNFSECPSLKNVTFYNCKTWSSALNGISSETITFNYCDVDEWNWTSNPNIKKVYINGGTINGNFHFHNTTALEEVVIDCPASPVTFDSDTFRDCKNIKSISITAGTIKYGVFRKQEKLETVNLGEGVTKIGEYAFSYCPSLKKIVIPKSVTIIDEGAFERCASLTDVVIQNSVASIGKDAFRECTALSSVDLGNGITEIGTSAFSFCDALKKIDIPQSVTKIEASAFTNCESLESIVIPKSATMFGVDFRGCKSLKTLAINGKIEPHPVYTYSYPFEDCISLESITLPDLAPGLDVNFKNLTNLKSANIPKDAEYFSFQNCTSLESIEVPSTIKNCNGAFIGCSSLKTVVLHEGLEEIYNAFNNCTSLKNITIPQSVKRIEGAFRNCTSLESITIPKNVTDINLGVFEGCENLVAINVDPANTKYTSVDGIVFNKDKTELYIYPPMKKGPYTLPPEVKTANFYGANSLTKITLSQEQLNRSWNIIYGRLKSLEWIELTDSGNNKDGPYSIYFHSIDGVIYQEAGPKYRYNTFDLEPESKILPEDGLILICVPSGRKEFTIPDFVKVVLSSAFSGSCNITHLVIPDTVTRFDGISNSTSIKKVTIGAGVTANNIAKIYFENCPQLTEIEVSPKNKSYASKNGALYTKDMKTLIYDPKAK